MKIGFWRARAFWGGVVGTCLGLALTGWVSRFVKVEASLWFPPRFQLPTYAGHKPALEQKAPEDWASDILLSQSAVEFLCQKFERSELSDRAKLVRASCLLISEGRVSTRKSGGTLELAVLSEDRDTSMLLCKSLLGYLSKTAQGLVDKEGQWGSDEMLTLENKLRVQEKQLANELWPKLDLAAPTVVGAAVDLAAPDAVEFEMQVGDYRKLLKERAFSEVRAAGEVPSFCVVEPAHIVSYGSSFWLFNGVAGCLSGIFFSSILFRRSRRS